MKVSKQEVIKKYGEVLGVEHYYPLDSLGKDNYMNNNKDNWRGQQCSYYNERFYYIKGGERNSHTFETCIFSSDDAGNEVEIIKKKDEKDDWSKHDNIFVNKYGVYIISSKVFYLFDFNGQKKTQLEIEGEIESYYICDERIFVVIKSQDVIESYTAIWYDTIREKCHTIYYTRTYEKGINSRGERSRAIGKIWSIMANRNRVILKLSFGYYYYPEDEKREECYELEGDAFYSYDFNTKKMICIDIFCPNLQPHLIFENPVAYHKSFYEDTIWGKEREEFQISVVAFDMAYDVMWVEKKYSDGTSILEPRNIDVVSKQKKVDFLQSWRIETYPASSRKQYFDGFNRYCATSDSQIFSYNNFGRESSNLYAVRYSAAQEFHVTGDYLFFINDDWAPGFQYQFERDIWYHTEPIRKNWMDRKHNYFTQCEEEAIEKYNQTISNKNTFKNVSSNKSLSKVKVNKKEYWTEFVNYAFGFSNNKSFLAANFSTSPINDFNWYALRMGMAKAHVEVSINTQKNTMRTALLVKDKDLFDKLEVFLTRNNLLNTVVLDRESKTQTISLFQTEVDFSSDKTSQFEWFMENACILRNWVIQVYS